MARDSSPLSKRLKALAARAGLPVESGQTNGAASSAPLSGPAPTPDDEQPTGEFPALAASDTPEEDRPTGEFPAVEPVEVPGAVPPPLRDETPKPAPVEEPPRPTVPPIWTDAPPESQSPLTAAQADGPTLSPPTLTSLAKTSEPEAEATAPTPSDSEPEALTADIDDVTPEPSTQLHTVVPDAPAVEPDESASRAAALDEALSLEPDPIGEDEPADEPETDEPIADEQATVAAVAVPAPAETDPSTSDATDSVSASTEPTESDRGADAELSPEADAASEPRTDAPLPSPEPADKLSLTGRIAAIRRRIRPETPPAPVVAAGDPAARADGPTDEEPPPPVTVVDPAPAAEATQDEHFPKPSFSERAALRRRVKTLRARRDAGLLELGAITIDQRRFGDPTAGTLLRRRTDELVDLDNEIAAIEYALEEHASATAIAALGTVRCLGCGTLVGPADRYCAHCGTPRPTDAAPSDARTDQGS